MSSRMDSIQFEVIRNALVEATEEMAVSLRRSAYSTNIKTRADFSCAYFDHELRPIAQAFGQAVHLGSLVELVPRAVREYGVEKLGEGDAILTNDPYSGGVHLNDVTLISPVHVQGECFGYVANLAHHVDVGGGAPASIGAFREVFQEGIIIPPIRLVRGGEVIEDLFALVMAQIRSGYETAGDFRAQMAANVTGVRRLQDLLARWGAETVRAGQEELLAYTERRTRRELARLPKGEFSAEGVVDNDGFTDRPVRLAARVAIHERGVLFDLTGSDPQRPAPVNSTYAMTYSACAYVLKCLIDPDVPVNHGFYRLVRLTAPAGTVVHARPPAPVVGGWETQTRLTDVMFKALAAALPERVPAGTKAMQCQVGFRRHRPQDGGALRLLRGHCRRLRRTGRPGRSRCRAGPRPEHRERSDRRDRDQLSGPDRPRYELVEESEGGRQAAGRPGAAPRLLFPGSRRFLYDPGGPGPVGPLGAFWRIARAQGQLCSESARCGHPAGLQGDPPAPAWGRGQLPHLWRGRVRGSRPTGAARGSRGCARGQGGPGACPAGLRGGSGPGHASRGQEAYPGASPGVTYSKQTP